IYDVCELTWRSVDLMEGIIATLSVDRERMAEYAAVNWSTATGLANGLAREKGLPFRTCHQIVGVLVRECVAAGVKPSQVTQEHLDHAAEEVTGSPIGLPTSWINEVLDVRVFLAANVTFGAATPTGLEAQ